MTPSPRVDLAVLRRDQAHAHAVATPLAAFGMALVIAFVGAALWPVVAPSLLVPWLLSLGAPFAARVALARAYRRAPDRVGAETWVRGFRLIFAVHGLAWTAAALVLLPRLGVADRAVISVVIAGVTASSLSTSAFDLVAVLLMLVPAVGPWSLQLLLAGERVYSTLGAMLMLFLGYMALSGMRIHRRYVDALGLRVASAARAEALTSFQQAFARLWQARHAQPQDLMRTVVDEVVSALGLRRAWLVRFEHDTDTAVVRAVGGTSRAIDDRTAWRLSTLQPYLAALSRSGRLMTTGGPRLEFAPLSGSPIAHAPDMARLDVPIGGAGLLGGVLCCERLVGPWSHDEETFATAATATLMAAAEEARRAEVEQQLRDLNQNLEQLVVARTTALQQSEARLAQTLDATNDGVWDFNLTSGAVYYSPVWARLLGYEPDEVPATVAFFWECLHPDDRVRVQQEIDEHLAGRRPNKDLEIRLRTKSGEYRWFHDHGKVVDRTAEGTPTRMLGTISDITERRQALEAVRDSDARFRALFDKSPVIFSLVDVAESRFAEMNEVGLRMIGWTRDQVIGKTTFELALWVDETERRRAARLLLDQGLVSGFEIQLRRKNGETFWALLSATLVTFQGQPYALSTLQDITERRELEARVLQSQKMEVVGHLAGGIAHDFNNVLTVIASTSELGIEDTRPGDPARDALETIRQASTRASGLTRQLLAFSRRQVLQPSPVDLNDLLMTLAPMVRRAVGEAVAIRIEPTTAPATVVVDRNSLDQVVLNLAINARDAMPMGGVLTMAVGTRTVEPGGRTAALTPGRYVTLAIHDTGTGMTEATRHRVFEPFFTTKDVGKGTGLGLSVAHGIVTQSGGDITIESAVGVGTTFTIVLPEAGRQPEPPPRRASQVAPGQGRVLVVDDDADIRTVLVRALTFAGYDIVAAGNGFEALDVLDAAGSVDLLLTDVMMPGMGGQELAARVRARYPTIRILFTSGYAENAIAQHGVLDAGVEFLPKPYSLQALTTKVRDVLDRPRPQ